MRGRRDGDTTAAFAPLEWKWLRSRDFDLAFILGIPSISLATIALVIQAPRLFWAVLAIDLWFLGYHHVIATYTRLCFDRKSFAEHSRLLIFGLLPWWRSARGRGLLSGLWVDRHDLLLLAVVPLRPAELGHFARLSRQGARARSTRTAGSTRRSSTRCRSSASSIARTRTPGRLSGWRSRRSRCPRRGAGGSRRDRRAARRYWVVRRFQAWRLGRLAAAHTLYMLTHFLIFGVGYLLIDDVTYGWLGINIWHNAQYILFVWLYNSRRFKDGVDPEGAVPLLHQPAGRLWLYLLTCLGDHRARLLGRARDAGGGALLGPLGARSSSTRSSTSITTWWTPTIWKVRKAPMRKTLGLD